MKGLLLLSHQAPAPRLPLLFLLLCFFPALLHFVSTDADAAPTLVTSLPGFDGTLPFRLETGYVIVDEENDVELFYYCIESEGDPRRDPVVLWLTGGDRCTVLSALFFEIVETMILLYHFWVHGLGCDHSTFLLWMNGDLGILMDSPLDSP